MAVFCCLTCSTMLRCGYPTQKQQAMRMISASRAFRISIVKAKNDYTKIYCTQSSGKSDYLFLPGNCVATRAFSNLMLQYVIRHPVQRQ